MPENAVVDLLSPERQAAGYVLVLPGIDGCSVFNQGLVPGLLDAGVPYAVEFYDWTLGLRAMFYNLRASQRHRSEAEIVAAKIRDYRSEHPETPVYLVGHSAGAALMLLALSLLPEGIQVTGGVLLAPAVSPGYDVVPALGHTTRGIWNFTSWGDWLFLGLLTTLFGSVDGKRTICAGTCGFSRSVHKGIGSHGGLPPLREIPFRRSMLRSNHYGGHLSTLFRPFIRNWIAPIVLGREPAEPSGRDSNIASNSDPNVPSDRDSKCPV